MIKMPDPVAIYKPEYGICWTSRGMAVEAVDGIQFITTTQAEAYKDACVKEALEAAARAAESQPCPYDSNQIQSCHTWDVASVEAGLVVRSLIPHNDNEQGNY